MDPKLISHENLTSLFKTSLAALIQNDPFLKDLHENITLDELNSILSLEHGDSMVLYLRRGDNQTINVIVKQNATVKDLKNAIKKNMLFKFQREPELGPTILNWKYIWKRYCLEFNGTKLLDQNKHLKEYGVYNKCEIKFLRILRVKK